MKREQNARCQCYKRLNPKGRLKPMTTEPVSDSDLRSFVRVYGANVPARPPGPIGNRYDFENIEEALDDGKDLKNFETEILAYTLNFIQSQIQDLLNTGNAILAELEKREQKTQ